MSAEVGTKYQTSDNSQVTVRFVDDDGSVAYRYDDGTDLVTCRAETFNKWFKPIPQRYVVELRIPRKGERYMLDELILVAGGGTYKSAYPVIIEEGTWSC